MNLVYSLIPFFAVAFGQDINVDDPCQAELKAMLPCLGDTEPTCQKCIMLATGSSEDTPPSCMSLNGVVCGDVSSCFSSGECAPQCEVEVSNMITCIAEQMDCEMADCEEYKTMKIA